MKKKVDDQLISYKDGIITWKIVQEMLDGKFLPEEEKAKKRNSLITATPLTNQNTEGMIMAILFIITLNSTSSSSNHLLMTINIFPH